MQQSRMDVFLSILVLAGLRGYAAEIPGRVVAVDGKTVTISLDAAAAPSADDKVEIFVIIEDLGEEALVAEGRVIEVNGQSVVARIEQSSSPRQCRRAELPGSHVRRGYRRGGR